jgi:hypothetical protein
MSDEKQCESPTTGQGPIVMYYVNNGVHGDFNVAVTDPGCFVHVFGFTTTYAISHHH